MKNVNPEREVMVACTILSLSRQLPSHLQCIRRQAGGTEVVRCGFCDCGTQIGRGS